MVLGTCCFSCGTMSQVAVACFLIVNIFLSGLAAAQPSNGQRKRTYKSYCPDGSVSYAPCDVWAWSTCNVGYTCQYLPSGSYGCCAEKKKNEAKTQDVCADGPALFSSSPCRNDAACAKGYWCHPGIDDATKVCCPGRVDNPCALQYSAGAPITTKYANRYFYDTTSNGCLLFSYSGTKGNQNNFESKQQCESTCKKAYHVKNPCTSGIRGAACSSTADCPATWWCHLGSDAEGNACCAGAVPNVCDLPVSKGTGDGSINRYFYSARDNACTAFFYTGIGGNQNNFKTPAACEAQCKKANPCAIGQALTVPTTCLVNSDCPASHFCHSGATVETTVCCPDNNADACSTPVSVGEGHDRLLRFYYNKDSQRCQSFNYRGLKGNRNSFATLRECQNTCGFQTVLPHDATLAGQCPCIKGGSSSACVAYSGENQATNFEEAISGFRDMTNPDATVARKLLPEHGMTAASLQQNSNFACTKYVLDYFMSVVKNSQDSSVRNSTLDELTALYGKYQLSSTTNYGTCKDFVLGNVPSQPASLSPSEFNTAGVNQADAQLIIDKITGGQQYVVNKAQYRGKRATFASGDFRYIFPVLCRARGEPVTDGSKYVGLCNICWKVGYLNDGFFPSFVNMMSCDTDTKCLSGYGTCQERKRGLTVLKRIAFTGSASQDYVEYSLDVPFACDCQVLSGSSLHSFVRA